MTAYEEYQNRVKVAVEKAFVTDIETQILLDGVVKVLGYQESISGKLSHIAYMLEQIHHDIPS